MRTVNRPYHLYALVAVSILTSTSTAQECASRPGFRFGDEARERGARAAARPESRVGGHEGQKRPYEVAPPAGLVTQRGTLPKGILQSYKDPYQPVWFTVASMDWADADRNVERHKRTIVRRFTERMERFRVVRDHRFRRAGAKAWLVEIENGRGAGATRQVQVFAAFGDRVLVLTYVTLSEHWQAQRRSFEKSIQSLQISR